MTHQKNSGRCWIFALLNAARMPFIKHYNLEEFEFSQAYLFFWDKVINLLNKTIVRKSGILNFHIWSYQVERCNFFLNTAVEVAKRGESPDGRLFSFILQDPTSDGGQWDMLVNLVSKHGLMPKKCFPESYSCESSARMNSILKSKVNFKFCCHAGWLINFFFSWESMPNT